MIKKFVIASILISFINCHEIKEIIKKDWIPTKIFTIKYKNGDYESILKHSNDSYEHSINLRINSDPILGHLWGSSRLEHEQGRGIYDRFKALHKELTQQQ